MHTLRKLLLLLALIGGFTAPASAQTAGYTDLSGNECWNAGEGIGGPSQWLCSDVLRNSRQIVATTISAAATFGTTAALSQLRWGGNLVITAQPLAAVITLPPNPVPDGAIAGVCNPTAAAFATNVTSLAANTSQTLTGGSIVLTTLAATTCVYVQFNRPTTTWYRIQ